MERRPTVMIADDDAALVRESSDALREAGFKVVEAGGGGEALKEALSRRVDLIVLDVSMNGLGGVETCHCLKAMPKTRGIPIILTAAKKDPAARSLGERTHGSQRILRKPFTPAQLVSVARDLVTPRSRTRALRSARSG